MTGEMCKSINKAIFQHLESIFGKCISEGHFPEVWKSARVVTQLKAPDGVRINPRSYRGISLLPWKNIGKDNGVSIEGVYRMLGCTPRLVLAAHMPNVLGLFIDFKGAFDYISWDRVLEIRRNRS